MIRKYIFMICESPILESLVTLCIVMNVVSMGMSYEGSTV